MPVLKQPARKSSGTVREASFGAVDDEHNLKVAFRSPPSSPCPDAVLFSSLPTLAPAPVPAAQVSRIAVAAAQDAGIALRVA
jgi:hypothetical protein